MYNHYAMTTYTHKDKPWFLYPATPPEGKHIVIIGGGLAGSQSAYVLAQRGFQVTLIERHAQLAQEASGNIAGVIYGKFSPHKSAQYSFYQQAYLHAIQHIPKLMGNSEGWGQCGVLQLVCDEAEQTLQAALLDKNAWPKELFHRVTPEQASNIAGLPIQLAGLFFPQGGWVYPKALCEAAVQHPNIKVIYSSEALQIKQIELGWQVHTVTDTLHADSLVIANGPDALAFEQTSAMPLRPIRGQVSHLKSKGESSLKTVICHKGYTTPAIDGQHPVGASFNLKDPELKLRESDRQYNIDMLQKHIPAFAEQLDTDNHTLEQGRVGFRCQTPDYLPIVGPVANKAAYINSYQNLSTGIKYGELPIGSYHNNLFINIAHGSRGISNTGLAAEILASYITGDQQPVEQEVLNALHPGRFIIRDIKRKAI